jgi:hypothetical protein
VQNNFILLQQCINGVFNPALSNSPKSTAKLSEKSRNRGSSNSFQWCPLSRPRLKCYFFLTVILHELSTTTKNTLGP